MDNKVITNASNFKRKSSGLGSQESEDEKMQFKVLHKVRADRLITKISWMKCELSFEDLNPFDNMWRLINTSLSQYNKLLDMNFQSLTKKESKIKEMALVLEK